MSGRKRKRELGPTSLKSTHLRPGGTIPAGTTLRGELWGYGAPVFEGGQTRHSLFLKVRLAREAEDESPYGSADKVIKYKVRCNFFVDHTIDEGGVSKRLNEILTEKRPVEMEIGVGRVVTWMSGTPVNVTIEYDGPIRLKWEAGEEEEIMGSPKARRETPVWMASPTPAPPAAPLTAAPVAVAGGSRFKPVSAFLPHLAARGPPAPPIVTPSEAPTYHPAKKSKIDLSQHTSKAQLPSDAAMDEPPPDQPPSSIEEPSSGWPTTQSTLEKTAGAEEEFPESARKDGFALIGDESISQPVIAAIDSEGDEGNGAPEVTHEQVHEEPMDVSMDVDHFPLNSASPSPSPSLSPKKPAQAAPVSWREQSRARRIQEAKLAIAAQNEVEQRKAIKLAERLEAAATAELVAEADAVQMEREEKRLAEERAAQEAAEEAAEAQEKLERRRVEEAKARQQALNRAAQAEQEAQAADTTLGALRTGLQVSGLSYHTIQDAPPVGRCNLMGIVLETNGLKQTRTGDWLLNVIMTDPSLYSNGEGEDYVVTMFRKTRKDLPDLERGDAILLRGVVTKPYNNKPKGQVFPDKTAGLVCLRRNAIKGDLTSLEPKIGKPEVDRLKALAAWWPSVAAGLHAPGHDITRIGPRLSTGSMASTGSGENGGKRGLIMMSEVGPNQFFNAIFKILAVVIKEGANRWAEMYITDGTVSTYTLRNFHGVTSDGVPANAIWCIGIMDRPPREEQPLYQEGNFLRMNNILSKIYKGEMELKWADKVTEAQADVGWNRRRVTSFEKGSEQAKAIEARLRAFKRGEAPPPEPVSGPSKSLSRSASPIKRATSPAPVAPDAISIDNLEGPPVAKAVETIPLATHLSTTYLDPTSHHISAIPDIVSNRTQPNRFRLHARVDRLLPRAGDTYVQKHCKKCRRAFTTPHCQSCNDTSLSSAEYRYRLIALLSHPSVSENLPVVIADDEAAGFLPALPPVSSSTNPNDHRKLALRLKGCCAGAEDVLMGAKMDGERTRPMIDWSVQSWVSKPPGGKKKAKEGGDKEEGMVVWKAFGMISAHHSADKGL